MDTNTLLIISNILFGIIDIILVIKLVFKLNKLRKIDIRMKQTFIFFEKGALGKLIFQGWSTVWALTLYQIGEKRGSIYLTEEDKHLFYALLFMLTLWFLLSFKVAIIFKNGAVIRWVYYEKKDLYCHVHENNIIISVGEQPKCLLSISKSSKKKINIFMKQNEFNFENT